MTRFTWGIVVGVLALVALSVGVAAVANSRQTPPDLSTPEGVVLAYALALQSGDIDRAWDLLAESARAQTTREAFISRASGLRGGYERARLAVENVQVEGDVARVELVRRYEGADGPLGVFGGAYTNRNTVRLARESSEWRIVTPPDPFVLQGPPR